MIYDVEATMKGQRISLEQWDGFPLDSLRDHAKTMVNGGIADRVQIKQDGKLVAHYPRVMRPSLNQ